MFYVFDNEPLCPSYRSTCAENKHLTNKFFWCPYKNISGIYPLIQLSQMRTKLAPMKNLIITFYSNALKIDESKDVDLRSSAF